MKNKVINFAFVLTSVFAVSACSGGSDWNYVGSSPTINYCLLIGQVDHNDSSARTAGIREVLGTRDLEHKRLNPNTENPIPNENFYTDSKGQKYRIVEMEHGEQKSTSGTTWDQQTANETTTLWINKHYANTWKDFAGVDKHGQSISFFVSNNDGMAMGAIGSVRWIKDMPIFGYDCNEDAVKEIVKGTITGTVDQSSTGQAAAIYMVARNLIDNPSYTAGDAVTYGFGKNQATSYGYIDSAFQPFSTETNAKLCRNVAVTKENVDKFNNNIIDRLNINEHIVKGNTKSARIYHSYYSATDNFLNSTMKPLFNELAPRFNFDEVIVAEGNGNDEAASLDKLNANLDKGANYFDAFILNMVKTTSTQSYLDAIYNTYHDSKGIVNTPIIFWNRQPTTQDNTVDKEAMHDKRFKTIIYVGFDATQGGIAQGQMIREYIEKKIEERYK